MDAHLEGLFASLEASFDAAVGREEDEAADDLAFSLQQGLIQRDLLARRGFAVTVGSGTYAALEMGLDHVVAEGERLVPLTACTAVLHRDLDPPVVSDSRLVEVLRARTIDQANAEITTSAARFRGRFLLCGPDHVVIATPRGEVVIALASVLEVRLFPED